MKIAELDLESYSDIRKGEMIMKKKNFKKKAIAFVLLLTIFASAFPIRIYANSNELRVGSIVTFGSYEQDDVSLNGSEPIDWYVLYIDDDDTALLLSKYVLASEAFNDSPVAVTWDGCTLRESLNDMFYKSAFSATERDAIVTKIVAAKKNPVYGTSAGEDTEDKVFVLSISEAKKYLKETRLLKGIPTEYAVSCGARKTTDGTCWYWLRNPGEDRSKAAYVTTKVEISEKGVPVDYYDAGVRPAIWVNINKLY